jgi:hypothetical protein
MIWIKKYSILLLLVIAGILFSLVHLFDGKRQKKEENEIIKFNKLRKAYGVPSIENGWIKESTGPSKEKWSDGIRGINTSHPVHLYKEIYLNAEQIESEKDAFHFEAFDTLQYRLILNHQYMQDDSSFTRVESKLIIYQPEKFPASYSKKLSNESADSVLRAWKMRIN